MIIIHGEQGTGKSTLAVNMLRNKKNSLYLTLENDYGIIRKLNDFNIDYTYLSFGNLIDLKYRILENGGLMNNNLEYVVIDSLNFIRDNKSYKEKIHYIEQLESDFKIKIALIFNTLNRMDKKAMKLIESLNNHKVIDINLIQQVPHLQ